MDAALAPPALRPRLSRRRGLGAACALAAAAVCALAGTRVLLHPAHAVVGSNPASDFQIMTWSLAWWPFALRHGLDPFATHLLWPPDGFSTLWMTTIPFPALVGLPLTLAAGPLVAYNVLMLAAVALAAGAAYLLCFELTGKALPSVVGGLLFGLSPYLLGHTMSQHLDLTFVFPLPLLALLALRRARGTTGDRRFVAGAAALLLALAGSSLELFVDTTLVLVVVAAIGLCVGEWRRYLLPLVRPTALAYAACLAVLAPIGLLALTQPHGPIQTPPGDYAVDLLNLVVPTPTVAVGGLRSAVAASSRFVGNIGERDGYVGLPLLAVSLLALRLGPRARLVGLVAGVALLLSLGPTLTVGGRPWLPLPFSPARLPIVGDALPARMTLYASLGLACLCALWLAQPGRRALRVAGGALVAASLLPNLWPPSSVANAWAISPHVAWSTPRPPAGFVDDARWRDVVPAGANVLVLPTRDRSAAGYWQTQASFRFALAVPETPFVPPRLAFDPTVARLADDVLPQLDGVALGGARLRAFALAHGVRAIVATPSAGAAWRALARRAAAVQPVPLAGSLVFPLRALGPLAADGEVATARAPGASLRAWLHFDGSRGHVWVQLAAGGRTTTRPVSAAGGDAESIAAAVGGHGRAAVAFTEARGGGLSLRVAVGGASGWTTATLDRSRLPIWSPQAVVAADGTVAAAWIDVDGATRSLHVAVLPPDGRWRETVLDAGDGLGTVALASAGSALVAAWADARASETRVLAAGWDGRGWRGPTTIAQSLDRLTDVTLVGPAAASLRWRSSSGGRSALFEARRRGSAWGAPRRLP